MGAHRRIAQCLSGESESWRACAPCVQQAILFPTARVAIGWFQSRTMGGAGEVVVGKVGGVDVP